MPTYEYKCPSGHVFEKSFPRMTARKSARCPQCGKRAERLISGGVGLVFKGSGFYVTDYKRAGEKKGEGEGEAKPAAESKSESKPESKPDTAKKKDSKDR
jgi:putative FmdB family regulatory protein